MKPITGRPFGVADALILVAAMACGLAASRLVTATPPILESVWTTFSSRLEWGGPVGDILDSISELEASLWTPSLAAGTLAWLAIQLRAPQPSRRRFARLPGAMASLVASATIGLYAATGLAITAVTEPHLGHTIPNPLFVLSLGSIQAGMAVLVCWATMMLSGGWRPEPTWLDRLGRLIGSIWIAKAIFNTFVFIFTVLQ